MGRVYAINPDKARGELFGGGLQVYTHTGQKIRYVSRVEFDKDADRGIAAVTAYYATEDGGIILDVSKNEGASITFKTWIQIIPNGQRPTVVEADDLTRNPDSSPDAEPYIFWSELEDAAAAIKANHG